MIQQASTVEKTTLLERSDIPATAFGSKSAKSKSQLLPSLPLPMNQSVDDLLQEIEYDIYDQALVLSGDNKQKAAEDLLHIQGATLRERLRRRDK
jgi:DNA-binding NtrC family response regulator